jgi:ERO1-like protein alpha
VWYDNTTSIDYAWHALQVHNQAVEAACPMPFDEGRLWKGSDGPELKQRLQQTFQNITRIMDCVGCEKCKLWGKLQTLGLATALKILFHSADCGAELPTSGVEVEGLELERNEVIALINLLERFSSSIGYYHEMSQALLSQGSVSHRPALSMSEPVS